MTALTAVALPSDAAAVLVDTGSLCIGGLDTTCPTNCPKVRLAPARFRYLKVAVNTPDPWNPNSMDFPMKPLCNVCRDTGHLSVPAHAPVTADGQCIGMVDLAAVPIIDELGWLGDSDTPDRAVMLGVLVGEAEIVDCITGHSADISNCLSFGTWEPGGEAYNLTEFRNEIDCPECGGFLGIGEPGYVYNGIAEPGSFAPCPTCMDERGIPRGTLPCPFPVAAPTGPCLTRIEVAV